ncbi:MAG: hypothetical protein R3F36_14980 [Candidatus Competibacteraceae bacterium]
MKANEFKRISGSQHARPIRRSTARFQTIVGQRLVGAAGQCLGQTAEQAVEQKTPRTPVADCPTDETKQRDLDDHERAGRHQQRAPTECIRQGAGRHFAEHDGPRPDRIQYGELADAQAEIEKQHREHGVVETDSKQ